MAGLEVVARRPVLALSVGL